MLTATLPQQTKTSVPLPLKRFLDYLFVECGLAGATITAYKADLVELWDHLVDNDVTLWELSIEDLQQHLIALHHRGLCSTSIARHLAAIKVFLRFQYAEKTLRKDVASLIDSVHKWRRIPDTLSYDRIKSLLMAPDLSQEFYLRDRALLELLYATGMRASEAASLPLDQVNLEMGYLRCMGKGRKERIIPIGKAALESVETYAAELRPHLLRDRHCDALFLSRTGRALDRTSVWRLINKYARVAGLSSKVSPHTIRHCFATHLLAGGADLRIVQELLGHADVTTTQIYTHVDEARLKEVHRKFHPRQ